MCEYIQTERLILRQFTEQDVNALFLILSNREVNTFLPMFPLSFRNFKIFVKIIL